MKNTGSIVLSFILFTFFVSCNSNDRVTDPIPDNVIHYDGIYHVWKWIHSYNTTSNDSILPGTKETTYTFRDNEKLYEMEGQDTVNIYRFYITSETKVFNNDTLNKMYFYYGEMKMFEKYIYLPTPSILVTIDDKEYGWIAYFTLKE